MSLYFAVILVGHSIEETLCYAPQPVANQSCAVIFNPRMDLQEAQKQDPSLQKLIAFKSAHRPRPEFSEWTGDSVLRRL